MKVRIRVKPREHELDGVPLDRLAAGTVREVSPEIGVWLISEGYAEPEMRSTMNEEIDFTDRVTRVNRVRETANDESRPRRRSTDR